jgi:hypothetical protein
MKNYLRIITLLAACGVANSLPAASHGNDGWKSLFDGKTLKGWCVVQGFANYYAEDGTIVGRTAVGSPNTFLTTYDHFTDFELEFEVKVDDGLNSGVMIRSHTRDWGSRRYFGPQVEIESSPGQSGYVYGEGLNTGWLSKEPESDDKAVNEHNYMKNGQWNKYRIIMQGDSVTTYINGNLVTKYKLGGIAREYPSGSIGLQVHGIKEGSGPYEVRWRNIKIKEL